MRDFNLSHVDFRWVWAKVLPQVYDDTLSYYEQLCKLANTLNELSDECSEHFGELADEINEHYDEITAALQAVNAELVRLQEEIDELDPTHVQGQIDALDARCDALESTASTHTTQIAGLTSSLANTNTALTTNVNTLNSRITNEISTVNNRITSVESAINANIDATNLQVSAITDTVVGLQGKTNDLSGGSTGQVLCKESNSNYDYKWVTLSDNATYGKVLFLGDSYENYGHWYTKVIAKLGLTDGVDGFYRGGSGHGFTVAGNLWITDMINFCSGRTDLSEFKHVILVGGLNDSTPDAVANNCAELRDRITGFFGSCRSRMPNAKIHFAYVGSAWENAPQLSGRGAYNRYVSINCFREEFSVKAFAHFMEGTQYSLYKTTLFQNDGIHPTDEGAKIMATAIAEALINGSCSVDGYFNFSGTASFDSGHVQAYSGITNNCQNGRVRTVFRQTVDQQVQSAFNITSSGVNLGSIPNWCFLRNSQPIPCRVQRSTANSNTSIQCKVQLIHGNLWVYADQLANSGSYGNLSFAVGDRMDMGDLVFDEFLPFSM